MKKDDDYSSKKEAEEEQKKLLEKNKDKPDTIASSEIKVNEFGRDQQVAICQFCKSKIFTNVEREVSWFGIFLCIFLLIVFKFYGIILIILLIPLTQSTIHSCPKCLNKIGVHTFYDRISLGDRIFTIQIMGMGIMITKKQLLGVFVFIFCSIVIYMILSSISFQRKILTETWDDYQSICTTDEIKCNQMFKYQDISWVGYVIRVNFNENFFSRNRVIFLMKMDPLSQNEEADLVLDVNDNIYNTYKIDIMKISRGDQIRFNATITRTISPMRCDLYYLQTLGGKIHIEPHVHKTGRYTTGDREINKGGQIYSELPGVVSDEHKKMIQNETIQ